MSQRRENSEDARNSLLRGPPWQFACRMQIDKMFPSCGAKADKPNTDHDNWKKSRSQGRIVKEDSALLPLSGRTMAGMKGKVSGGTSSPGAQAAS